MIHRINSLAALAVTLIFVPCCASGQAINAFAGNHTSGYSGDGGPALSASCFAPVGIAADGSGNVYFCDQGNDVIRKVDASGVITTIAGTGAFGYSGDGGPATAAKINQPTSVATDALGNIYFTDDANNVIRLINGAGIISTVAGNGTAGYLGDGSPATLASLSRPAGVAVDRTGSIYIADTYNHAVRKVDFFTGKISTVAGTGIPGTSPNGTLAVEASLNYPKGVAIDNAGNILIVDQGNDLVRKVTLSNGELTTFAGTGSLGYSGDGGYGTSANINIPTEIAFDASDNLFIADYSNHVIRMERPDGVISTYAGNGTSGRTGNGGPAKEAELEGPYGVAVDHAGNVYVTDELTNEVRVVGFTSGINSFTVHGAVAAYPVPCGNSFTITIPESALEATVSIADMAGRMLSEFNCATKGGNTINCNAENLPAGSYLVKIVAADNSYRCRIVKAK